MSFLSRKLAELSGTPELQKDDRAYLVAFREGNSQERHAILTLPTAEDMSAAIRNSFFNAYPRTTDYMFREIDYLAFQTESLVRGALGSVSLFNSIQTESEY